ncbi:islet cell auto antigen 1 [Paragonimus westermani]|uniref:Islet cell auto antigen 1 n=1 Tax=Paragonimus westermani TaxID=34504 RepID=A0A5J4NTS5_9TREM|nr:islet cell auto antigen 1 [Paragonimus westermani]
MGRFLKRYSLEDKTQAGKIMSAAGKALSHSAQQRLLLRSPLDRVLQEVKTFRQRAISDTLGTLKSMEDTRTEYRGALLWMKHVSEELDPDTYKQLEKFRRVQAQVRKSKIAFDRLKIDSMQKIDLLSASRCNMLSHVLVGYQNSLLTFLEKSSRTMIAVADRFKGYQYYEFSVLKHLRPESKKLAGVNESDDVDSMFQRSAEQNDNRSPQSSTATATEVGVTEDELDRRLDEIFRADDVGGSKSDDLPLFGLEDVDKCLNDHSLDLLTGADSVPAEHRELLTDLFAMEEGDFGQQSNQPGYVASSSRWDGSDLDTLGVFGGLTTKSSLGTHLGSASGETRTVCEGTQPEQHSSAQEDDPWSDFQMSESCALPSQLLDRRDAYGTNSSTTMMKLGDPMLRGGSVPSVPTGPTSSISRPSQQDFAVAFVPIKIELFTKLVTLARFFTDAISGSIDQCSLPD